MSAVVPAEPERPANENDAAANDNASAELPPILTLRAGSALRLPTCSYSISVAHA